MNVRSAARCLGMVTLGWLAFATMACGTDTGKSAASGADQDAGKDGNGTSDAGPSGPTGPDLPPEGGAIDGVTLALERSTPEQIGIVARVQGQLPEDARLTVRYWPKTASEWQVAQPLLRINPEWIAGGAPEAPVDAFAGTIFDIPPNTSTVVELTLEQPGKEKQVQWTTVTTRALPPPAPKATTTVKPGDDLQARLHELEPGDVLELENGTYEVSGLHLKTSGTEAQPIYIRGASRSGVVIRDKTGIVLQLWGVSHVVIEDLTLEGSKVDSGTATSSVGISFWNGGANQEYVTLRGLDIHGVDAGIVAAGRIASVLVYNCDLRGNNTWIPDLIETNKTWNDDGIRIPGEGNCAFDNTMHGFGDTFAVTNGVHSAAVHFYRNLVTMTGDDTFEADYGTRNLGFYDNYITNSGTLLSLDPLWGGPLYCFRNIAINTMRGPFKLNSTNSGFFIYNNTMVRTEGRTKWGWVQYNDGALRGWAYRNNLLVYRGGTGNTLAIESGGNAPIDFTHNGWFPDGAVWWTTSGGSFNSFEKARAGLPKTKPLFGDSELRHEADLVFKADPFASTVTLGESHLDQVKTRPMPSLEPSSPARSAGVALPNITDGFSGSAPDMGAIIEGRPIPSWGAKRP